MKIRLGIVGLGGIAQKAYLPLVTALDSVEIAVVASRHTRRAKEICERYRLPRGVTDLDAFVRSRPRAAIVLTPSPTHAAIVRYLLERDIDVLVEKPATLSSRDTKELGDLAHKRHRVLMVAFNRRYAPLYQKAKELFAGHRVALCLAEKHRDRATHSTLFSNYIDDTIHMIDLLRWFGGDGRAVTTTVRRRGGHLVDAVSVVAFHAGGTGVVATSMEAGGWEERVSLYGDGLSVQVQAFRQAWVTRKGQDRPQVLGREVAGDWTTSLEVRGFPQLIQHFLDCVRTRAAPLTNAEQAYESQLLLEEMVAKSAAQDEV